MAELSATREIIAASGLLPSVARIGAEKKKVPHGTIPGGTF
jgi:hypothetical protein